jgi:hypothetical protein
MKWFLILFSVAWVAAGGFMILYTERSRQWLGKAVNALPGKIMAVIVGVIGVLLLLSAGSVARSGFIFLLGFLALAKAGVIYFNPGDLWVKLKRFYLEEGSDQAYRLHGIIALIVGTAVFSWIF